MSRKKRQKESESVLKGAKLPVVEGYSGLGAAEQPKKTSPFLTVPLALVAIALAIFALVKLIKWSWFF